MMDRRTYLDWCEKCPANFGILMVEEEDPEDPEGDLLKVGCVAKEQKRRCGLKPY